jgi:DNA-binding HxlR family transcriptional regulator
MQNFLPASDCPVRNILARLGDKWSFLVLITLDVNGTMRFGDIHKSIGDISHRMLTVTLRSLENDGLISRKIYPEMPPRVEYCLTESGKKLMPHIHNMVEWALEHMPNIVKTGKSREN